MSSSVRQQISLVRKLSKDISSNITLQNVGFQFSKTLIDKLDIVTGKNVIRFLINNSSKPTDGRREEYAFNIVSQRDFLQSAEKEIVRQYEAYQTLSLHLLDEWNCKIKELNEILNTLPKTNDEAAAVYVLREKYLQFRNGYVENKGMVDVIDVKDKLLTPILDAFPNYRFGSEQNPTVDKILLLSRDLIILLKQWEKNKESFSAVFKNYADRCEASFELLLQSKDYFKNNTKAVK